MNFTLSLNELFYIATTLISLGVGYAYLKYTTSENVEKSKKQEERIIKLEGKCAEMIEEDKAFKSFVTIDIFQQRNEHLSETMHDIKQQNNTIINLLTKGK
jgi:hypothetical protein